MRLGGSAARVGPSGAQCATGLRWPDMARKMVALRAGPTIPARCPWKPPISLQARRFGQCSNYDGVAHIDRQDQHTDNPDRRKIVSTIISRPSSRPLNAMFRQHNGRNHGCGRSDEDRGSNGADGRAGWVYVRCPHTPRRSSRRPKI
jgi:hypothetical protein